MAHFASDLQPGFYPYQSAELRALVEDPAHRLEVRHDSGRAATFFLARPTEAVRVGGDEGFLQGVDRISRHHFDQLHAQGEVSTDRFFNVVRAAPVITTADANLAPGSPNPASMLLLLGLAAIALIVVIR